MKNDLDETTDMKPKLRKIVILDAGQYSDGSLLWRFLFLNVNIPKIDIPNGHYSERFLFQKGIILKDRYSERSLFHKTVFWYSKLDR